MIKINYSFNKDEMRYAISIFYNQIKLNLFKILSKSFYYTGLGRNSDIPTASPSLKLSSVSYAEHITI